MDNESKLRLLYIEKMLQDTDEQHEIYAVQLANEYALKDTSNTILILK